MTRDQAYAAQSLLKKADPYAKVTCEEWGFGSGNWRVNVTYTNPSAGNINLHVVESPVTDTDHAALIIKVAKGKATKRDRTALSRIAAAEGLGY